jgi:hypothetical protein
MPTWPTAPALDARRHHQLPGGPPPGLGRRPRWSAVFKVALTMNLSMLELQGELARQRSAPTPEQRADLMTHPMRSVELLMQAGVSDEDWLQAVARHHEQEDGSGYPTGRTDVGELASLVRRADVYTAKLASRNAPRGAGGRPGRPPDVHAGPGPPDDGGAGEGIRHLPAGLLRAPGVAARWAWWCSAARPSPRRWWPA